jgi:hypothetical protein
MFEFFVFILFGMFMFNMGRAYQLFETRKFVRRIANENGIDIEKILTAQLEEKEIVPIHTETIDGTILLYNADTNEFLGQAQTLDEAAQVFNQRSKNTNAEVVHNENKFFFVDGKLTKTL